MSNRNLALINLVGCLVLGSVILSQWLHERAVLAQLEETRTFLADAETAHATAQARADSLERDVGLLKESIEGLTAESQKIQAELHEARTEVQHRNADLAAANNALAEWKTAVEERDKRLAELNTLLAATRKRLDEAIARLRQTAENREGS